MTEERAVYGDGAGPSIMMCDGKRILARRYRMTGNWAGDSLYWRFITTKEQVVVVRPLQIPSSGELPFVPWRIESALLAVRPLIEWTHGLYASHEPDVPESARAERVREIALYEINEFVRRIKGKRLVSLPNPGKDGCYTAKDRADVVKRLTRTKDAGAVKLEIIRKYIQNRLFREDHNADMLDAMGQGADAYPPPPGGVIQDAHLRRLVNFMGDCLGVTDMVWKVMLKHNRHAPASLDEWAREMAESWNMKPSEAKRHLAERLTFIAECRFSRFTRCFPIEDVEGEGDVLNMQDAAPYQIPGGKDREPEARRPTQAIAPREDGRGEDRQVKSALAERDYISATDAMRLLDWGKAKLWGYVDEGKITYVGERRSARFHVPTLHREVAAIGQADRMKKTPR